MTDQPRYAIYFVPAEDTDLYRFGSAVLGYDVVAGQEVPQPEIGGADATAWYALTQEPRRYGFHATLKAPFRMAPDYDEAQLIGWFDAFAGTPRPRISIAPAVMTIGDFVAIVPGQSAQDLDQLADECVTGFDRFRAPMNEAERARRMRAKLTRREIANLDQWGYPYVLDTFRFHMTLSGPLTTERRTPILKSLQDAFARHCGTGPIAIDKIALMRQARPDDRFRVMRHRALKT